MKQCIECNKWVKVIKRFVCNTCYERHRRNNEYKIDHFDRNIILSNFQKEHLIGTMLGDAYLENTKNMARLVIQRSYRDLGYAEYQYNIFKNICKSGVKINSRYDKRISKNTYSASFKSRYICQLSDFRKEWYDGKIKIVPNNLILTPTIIAIWFLDDGSIFVNKNGRMNVSFNTQGFSYQENINLAGMLSKRYDSHFGVSKSRDKFFIFAGDGSSRRLFREIDDFVPSAMLRKANKWRSELVDLNNKQEYKCSGIPGCPIKI